MFAVGQWFSTLLPFLRLLNNQVPPFDQWIRQPEGNYTTSGISLKIAIWLANKLNFT